MNGYTDSIGSADYNLRLSDRRARAVVDYLEKVAYRRIGCRRTVMGRQTVLRPIAPRKAARRIGV